MLGLGTNQFEDTQKQSVWVRFSTVPCLPTRPMEANRTDPTARSPSADQSCLFARLRSMKLGRERARSCLRPRSRRRPSRRPHQQLQSEQTTMRSKLARKKKELATPSAASKRPATVSKRSATASKASFKGKGAASSGAHVAKPWVTHSKARRQGVPLDRVIAKRSGYRLNPLGEKVYVSVQQLGGAAEEEQPEALEEAKPAAAPE